METPEGEGSPALSPNREVSSPQQPDPQQVVEEYFYLLDGVLTIEETPKELHTQLSDILDSKCRIGSCGI